jgi:Protein of unknown function (DUF2515)
MTRRLQFPLDPKAVREANKALWKAHPEMGQRLLSMDQEDAALRKEWVDAYLKAKGKQAEPAPAKLDPNPVQACPPPSCEDLWQAIDKEVKPILEIKDPIKRNSKISAAYAGLYQRKPEYEWIGLAAIVSRQAGCAMHEAKAKVESNDWFGKDDAKAAFEGLGEANKLIFSNIYPVIRFAELNGGKRLKECKESGGRHVPEQLIEAVDQIEKGTPEGRKAGADLIAEVEQRTVVQDQVYSNKRFKDAFKANERWSTGVLGVIGRSQGAKPPGLPLSSECGKDPPIMLEGSILNADDRVKFYKKLMNEFASKDVKWKTETMENIKKQEQK